MCGIAGIVNFRNGPVERSLIQKMTDCMAHRGPDADGFFVDQGVALGHRRLSIIDLSSAANQPFTDITGRYVMVFNGEMYNYEEVKGLIDDYAFHTHSDTEVLIAAYAKWGPDCLRHFRGMFAFVIWDKEKKEIFAARDRMGVKPLYYFLDDNYFIFASETRSVLSTGLTGRSMSPSALHEYFSYQSISYPFSPVEGIMQLEAGSWLKIKKDKKEKKLYWDVTDSPVDFDFSDKDRVQRRVRELLLNSVKRRLVSDVPVGAFLSGGIDSSAVVSMMAEAGGGKPNTFNVSFEEKEFDESHYAEIVAKKFGTNHTRIHLSPRIFLDELQDALDAMDSPSGDGINTFTVSRAIRQNGMTVALSGIGGDELFAGYPFFNQYLQLQRKRWLWRFPPAIRTLAASGMKGSRKDRLLQILRAPSCSISQVYPIIRQILSPDMLQELTSKAVAGSSSPRGEPIAGSSLQRQLMAKEANIHRLPLLSQVSAAEYLGYTQHTLLKDTDQMGMAASLEIREPFFDQDLVEFVLAIPDRWKKPAYPKSLLVESLKPLLPDEIVFRKKQGFLFPWNTWLKNDLRSFCDKYLKNMTGRSFIHGARLMDCWQRFLAGDERVRWSEIWLFVVLEYWMEKNGIS
jgi:asparagine synthase (glutamine-hydrolysing)